MRNLLRPITRNSARGTKERGGVRIGAVTVFVLVAALAAGAFWFGRNGQRVAQGNTATASEQPALSDSTRAVLAALDAPIEIHFYSLLDPASVPESTRAFAGRVRQLLGDYERESNGRIKLVRFETDSYANANAASVDGIRVFNLDKGDACYLGIAIVRGQKKESIPHLSQEWEQAIEFDLSRAIARVNEPAPQSESLVSASKVDATAAEQLIRSNPKLATASLAEGTEMLRAAALADFKSAATEMENRIKEAEQRLMQAQSEKSEVEQKAAVTQLQQIRSEQTQKLKEIAARLQNQIAALERAKASAH